MSATAIVGLLCMSCLRLPDEPVEQGDRPPLSIVASNIRDMQTDVPRDVRPTLVWNQPLDPLSLASAQIYLESGALNVRGVKRYDLLTRTLTFIPSGNLRANLWYRFKIVELPLSVMGTRSTEKELNLRFRTSDRFEEEVPPPSTRVRFTDEIFPLFRYNCACHGETNPMMGIRWVFDDPDHLLRESVATDSKQWKNWKVIDPGRHERSYVMYKLLGDERLGLPTLMGDRMPPPPYPELPMEDLAKIRDWIEQGAGWGE